MRFIAWVAQLLVDPRVVHAWVQLLVLDLMALVGAVFAIWAFMLKPLKTAIKVEAEARMKADTDRDGAEEKTRREVTTAVGRVEIMERSLEILALGLESLHKDQAIVGAQVSNLAERLQSSEVSHERVVGELRTSMATMETRLSELIRKAILDSSREAVEQAARIYGRGESEGGGQTRRRRS